MLLKLGAEINQKLLEKRCKIVITGASGWLGRALLEALFSCYGDKIVDFVLPISSSLKAIQLRNNVQISCYDYEQIMTLEEQEVIVWHLAFVTKDQADYLALEQYRKANLAIRDRVVEIINHFSVRGMVYASSGAIYNSLEDNPYGYLKLDDEKFFSELAQVQGFTLLVPRIFNVSGPYINKHRLYALSDFINQAVTKKAITINARHKVFRSYVALENLYCLAFAMLFDEEVKGKRWVFDIAHKHKVELAELAHLIMMELGVSPEIKRQINNELPDNNYLGDPQEFYTLCQKYKITISSLELQITNMLAG